jgi:hypothetical protein
MLVSPSAVSVVLVVVLLITVTVPPASVHSYRVDPDWKRPWKQAFVFLRAQFPLQSHDEVWLTMLVHNSFAVSSCAVSGVEASRVEVSPVDNESTRDRWFSSHREVVCYYEEGQLPPLHELVSTAADADAQTSNTSNRTRSEAAVSGGRLAVEVLLTSMSPMRKYHVPVWVPPRALIDAAPRSAVCSPVMFSRGHAGFLRERLQRLRDEVGVDLFLMYASTPAGWLALRHLQEEGEEGEHASSLMVLRMSGDHVHETHYHHQKEAQYDCVLRARALGVQWVLMLDQDELLRWPHSLHSHRLADVLDSLNVTGVSFASYTTDLTCCLRDVDRLSDAMVYTPVPLARCNTGPVGRRKFAVQVGSAVPRVLRSNIHNPGGTNNIALSGASGVFVQHLQGLMGRQSRDLCTQHSCNGHLTTLPFLNNARLDLRCHCNDTAHWKQRC